MKRNIVEINQEKCNGCGACAAACHEGAIAMVNGKAQLLRDDYCDGLGDCLPACPVDAIRIIQREALAYDQAAVLATQSKAAPQGCPGTMAKKLNHPASSIPGSTQDMVSRLSQWPVQLKLVPVNAPYFQGAHLLVAADCAAYAFSNFHERFLKDRIALIGCPKLDGVDYSEKLTELLKSNDIQSVTIVRMEVPCCGGLEAATKKALEQSGKALPFQVVVLSTDGRILS